jgi:hypothetical protein
MSNKHGELASALLKTVTADQGADGGWAYSRGKKSRLEPTAWAVLALGASDSSARSSRIERALAAVSGWQLPDGLLADVAGVPNIAFNGLALVALAGPAIGKQPALPRLRLANALLENQGVALRDDAYHRQKNTLRGWPWTDGTFSWVEPTAWCVLGLKRARPSMDDVLARRANACIAEGEALLLDRACRGGGWNYGNSNIFGKELHPYIPTTAVALLALQDRPNEKAVVEGVTFLEKHWHNEPSGPALSLALIAMAVQGRVVPDAMDALALAYERTAFLGNLAATAEAAYALLIAERPGLAAAVRV